MAISKLLISNFKNRFFFMNKMFLFLPDGQPIPKANSGDLRQMFKFLKAKFLVVSEIFIEN